MHVYPMWEFCNVLDLDLAAVTRLITSTIFPTKFKGKLVLLLHYVLVRLILFFLVKKQTNRTEQRKNKQTIAKVTSLIGSILIELFIVCLTC